MLFSKRGFNVSLVVLLVVLLVVGTAAIGCQQKPAEEKDKVQDVVVMMGPMGGTLYPFGATMTDIMFTNFSNVRANVTPGGAISNLEVINSNKAQMGHTTGDMAAMAWQGTEPFTAKLENIRGFMKIMDQPIQFVVAADSPIKTIKDIKDKKYPLKLAVNPKGNASELIIRKMLEVHGITYQDIESWGGKVHYVSHNDMVSLYKDRHIEAMFLYTAMPSPIFVECAMTKPVRLLPLDGAEVEILEKTFFMEPFIASKDTYTGMTEDTKIYTGCLMLAVNKDMPDDFMYEFTKLLFQPDNLERLKNVHAAYKNFLSKPERAASGMPMPIHPGVEKYYREVGWVK